MLLVEHGRILIDLRHDASGVLPRLHRLVAVEGGAQVCDVPVGVPGLPPPVGVFLRRLLRGQVARLRCAGRAEAARTLPAFHRLAELLQRVGGGGVDDGVFAFGHVVVVVSPFRLWAVGVGHLDPAG